MERKDRKHGYSVQDEEKYLGIKQLIIEWDAGRCSVFNCSSQLDQFTERALNIFLLVSQRVAVFVHGRIEYKLEADS